MTESNSIEFTGERVVPGQVEADLWNEHVARYAFAAGFAQGKRVLDAGSGTGYGSADLARVAANVTGLDSSREAVEWARRNYGGPAFLNGSCTMLPFRGGAFDLVVAFEVIEHLHQQTSFIAECRRVLSPGGLLMVSTPNTLYYAEARAEAGPNPFHEHEFEAGEFKAMLRAQFSNVSLLLQNRSECFAFYPPSGWKGGRILAESGADRTEAANFFVALCSNAALPEIEPIVYVPRVANLLREREQHIHKLRVELALKEQWLAEVTGARDKMMEIAHKNQAWAQNLSGELDEARARIVQLQDEFTGEQQRARQAIDALEAENQKKTDWALALSAEVDALRGQVAMVVASRWVRAGHKIGLGPPLPGLDKPAQ
jgi:SAM-dependent methyltransferase